MKQIFTKYLALYFVLIIALSYYFFIDTAYQKENLFPFFLLLFILSIGLFLTFRFDKKRILNQNHSLTKNM